ncbi:MAG TPA: hypothetical protein PLU30_26725 [Verrucomicrobiae bacterium]|nr:hypothetical protein [Verrucomicrobiae bacterium]
MNGANHSLAVLAGALIALGACRGADEVVVRLKGDGANDTGHATAYGVRWKLICDEVNDYLAPCERVGRARGLKPADFDKVFPYRDMRRCNVLELEDGTTRITYEGENRFSLTGSNGNVFVEIPKHYAKRRQSGGYEYRYVSDRPLDGFSVDPAFIENGKILDKIYVSAYEAHLRDGKMRSVTGVYPTADRTRPEYRRCARANGSRYGILDIRTLNMVQNLFLIEYADRDSQAAVGQGWGKIHQPRKTALRCTLAETGVNRIVVSDWTAALGERLFAGSAIEMVDYDTHAVLVTGRTLLRVSPNTSSAGYTAVYFDGEPIDTTTQMVLGGAAQKTGWSDALSTPSGHTENCGGGADAGYRNAVRYRYMENLWGNVWHFIDGLNLTNGAAYVCNNMRDYESGVTDRAYRRVAATQAIQTDNATVGGDREIHYMKNLTFDPREPFLALPKDYVNGREISVAHAQRAPRLGSDALRHANFGDYYYLTTNATCYVHGGGFDHFWRCGLFTLRGWTTDASKWYLYGARLIYKPM